MQVGTCYLAFDIGGTNLKIGLVDSRGKILEKKCEQTPKNLADLADLLQKNIAIYHKRLSGIAVSCPGKVDTKQGVIYHGGALTYLHEYPLKQILTKAFGLPVVVINDGKAAVLAEAWCGHLQGINYGVGLILGTGLGGGLILDGHMYQGANDQAGELSFLLSPPPTAEGQILGQSCSAVRFVEKCAEMLNLPDKQDGKQVFEQIGTKNPLIYPDFQAYCHRLAELIINLQAILDIQRVVIGGGISEQTILLKEIINQYKQLRAALPLLSSTIQAVEILPCKYRNDANLLGGIYQLQVENNQLAIETYR